MTLDNQPATCEPAIESDALRANLLETAVGEVAIDPAYDVLIEIVRDYRGISNSLTSLLLEISHPFHNWKLILPRLRAFVLKNHDLFRRHDQGPEAFSRFIDLFLLCLEESRKNEILLAQAIDAMIGYLERLISGFDGKTLNSHEPALAGCFERLANLDDRVMLHMVQGNHPVKKIIGQLLRLAAEQKAAGENPLDLAPAARLFKRILTLNYQYWLAEDDPLAWFTSECGSLCDGWQAGRLFNAISHQQIRSHLAGLGSLSVDELEQMLAGGVDGGEILLLHV